MTKMSTLTFETMRLRAFIRMTPEERWEEARRILYEEPGSVDTERRQRAALEAMEKLKKEREERKKVEESLKRQKERYEEERRMQEAKQKEEEEKKAAAEKALLKAKQDQLKKERLRWQKKMMVDEEPSKRPRYTISALKEEQRRRQEEKKLCPLPQAGDQGSRNPLTFDLKIKQQQEKKKSPNNTLDGEEKMGRDTTYHPKESTYLLFDAQPGPKPKAVKPSMQQQQWTDRLKTGYWMDKYRQHRERLDEKRKLKAEEQHARFTAYKESRSVHFYQQQDCYMGGFPQKRNSILKSMF